MRESDLIRLLKRIEKLEEQHERQLTLGDKQLTERNKRMSNQTGKPDWLKIISIVVFMAIPTLVVYGIWIGTVQGTIQDHEESLQDLKSVPAQMSRVEQKVDDQSARLNKLEELQLKILREIRRVNGYGPHDLS